MRILSQFINGFDFIRMAPDDSVIAGGVPATGSARALVEPGRAMAIYVRKSVPRATLRTDSAAKAKPPPPVTDAGPAALQIRLPAGSWQAEWIDTASGRRLRRERVEGDGVRTLRAPAFDDDIALRLVRTGGR